MRLTRGTPGFPDRHQESSVAPWYQTAMLLKSVKQRATLSRLGVETASNSFHLGV